MLNINQIRTSPYHPLPYVLFVYREVPQSSTGFSPFTLLYDREVRGPLNVLKEEWEASKMSDENVLSHILSVRERLEEMSELVGKNVKGAQKCQKNWYDQNARERELIPGEEVLVLLLTNSNKLLAQWQGPYRVLSRVSDGNYI